MHIINTDPKMKTKRIITDQKGAALVEFAVVLFLLVFLVFGAVEFGILYYNKQIITNASREGARAGIIAYGREDYYKTDGEIKEIVKNYCINHLITFSGSPDLKDDDITLVPDEIGLYNRTNTASPPFEFGSSFTVAVTYNYGFLLPGFFGFGNVPISAATTMNRESSI